MAAELTLADIRDADLLLGGAARRTPMLPAHWLAPVVGGPILLKCENLQRSGSFKVRGALVRLSRLSPRERAAGVVAASAGNHAQGVALAARDLGIAATVFMPRSVSLPKLVATKGYGAVVELVGDTVEEALAAAQEHAARTGAVLIHPFDHRDIVAGQGTVGLEIVEQVPEVATVVVPAGGGGLLAGIAVAVKELRPNVELVGVQAAGSATLAESFRRHRAVALSGSPATMADGIAIGRPGDLPVSLAADLVDRVVTVTEEQIAGALLQTLERAKLLAEPAGVVGIAAVLADPQAFPPPVAVVLSGGNIDAVLLDRIVQHGLANAGRYVAMAVRLADRPGQLAALLQRVAQSEVNVLDVSHLRRHPGLAVGEVEIVLLLETRGPGHREEVLAHLRGGGYAVNTQ